MRLSPQLRTYNGDIFGHGGPNTIPQGDMPAVAGIPFFDASPHWFHYDKGLVTPLLGSIQTLRGTPFQTAYSSRCNYCGMFYRDHNLARGWGVNVSNAPDALNGTYTVDRAAHRWRTIWGPAGVIGQELPMDAWQRGKGRRTDLSLMLITRWTVCPWTILKEFDMEEAKEVGDHRIELLHPGINPCYHVGRIIMEVSQLYDFDSANWPEGELGDDGNVKRYQGDDTRDYYALTIYFEMDIFPTDPATQAAYCVGRGNEADFENDPYYPTGNTNMRPAWSTRYYTTQFDLGAWEFFGGDINHLPPNATGYCYDLGLQTGGSLYACGFPGIHTTCDVVRYHTMIAPYASIHTDKLFLTTADNGFYNKSIGTRYGMDYRGNIVFEAGSHWHTPDRYDPDTCNEWDTAKDEIGPFDVFKDYAANVRDLWDGKTCEVEIASLPADGME